MKREVKKERYSFALLLSVPSSSRRLALLGCFLLVATACGQAGLAPVDLNPEDMCSMCRMAISEKRFAAEFITRDGEAMKFDDIACMRDHVREKKNEELIAAWYVSDYDSAAWLNARTANFIISDRFKTPMGGGIIAVELSSRAATLAQENNARVITFDEVFQ